MIDNVMTLEVQGVEEISRAMNEVARKVSDGSLVAKAALVIERQAKINATGRPGPKVQTGRLRASIATDIVDVNTARVGTNVDYACVVGSRQQVYEPVSKTAANIGNYPYATVLSKDGVPHNIVARQRFSRNLIEATAITTRLGRNPLVVTNDHLVLVWRDGKVIWERADSLKDSDQVFGKRSHNAVTDNSNKESYLCFCGTIFWVDKYKAVPGERKYCSRECRHKYGPHDQNTGMHWQLSAETKERLRLANLGEKNPNWRDGAWQQPYPDTFNGHLKAAVKERDGHQCQLCATPWDLLVHHKDWDKMNSQIDNLITLCRSCHGKLRQQDCELPEINVNQFVPKPITRLDHQTIRRIGKARLPYIYDFTVEKENSFVVSGLLVHNSAVEFGHSQQVGRFVPAYALGMRGGGLEVTRGLGFRLVNPTAPAYPFLGPTIDQTKDQIQGVMVAFGGDLGAAWGGA